MRVFSIYLRTSLLTVTLTCLTAAVASGQIVGYPASTARQDRSPQGQYPNPEGDGPRSVPDPGRQRVSRDPWGAYVFHPRRVTVQPVERKLTDAQKRQLYPSAAERATFAAMLRGDGTGIARLLPYVECNADARVFNVKGTCADSLPPIPGRGSFYSFITENHKAKQQADLTLNNGEFQVGFADTTFGVLTTLGDVPLDGLTLQSSAVAPLHMLAPARTLGEMAQRYEQSSAALASAHHAYGTASPAQLNTTYVLRSTAYKPNGRKSSDVIVAFRVTRQDADGSVTIIWKQLRASKG